MKRWAVVLGSVVVLGCLAAFAWSQAMPGRGSAAPAQAANATFERIKTLAGEWEGTLQGVRLETSYRVVSGGSAVMNVLKAGTESEMVTMFHLDGPRVMVTHYCSEGNQPRMVWQASTEPNVIAFTFKDITNLAGPNADHMRGLVLTLVDADHHNQRWTFRKDGKDQSETFEFHRKAVVQMPRD